MYDLKKKTLNDKPIDRLEVGFQVPCVGFFRYADWDRAVAEAESLGLDARTCVRPCTVAITKCGMVEVLM